MANGATQFAAQWQGRFESLLSWDSFDAFWEKLLAQDHSNWYIFAVGQALPEAPESPEKAQAFLAEISALLHKEHQERYCGIVYVDDKEAPNLIKIYDPNNLGVSCGYSDNPPPPGWVMSKTKPEMIEAFAQNIIIPGKRKRWWQKLFGSHVEG